MGLRGGRGSRGGPPRLEPETAAYFQRALETLQEGLSDEEMALFAPNVLEEAAAACPALLLHPQGSLLLQSLLPHAPPPTLGRLLGAMVEGGGLGVGGAKALEAGLKAVLPALGRGLGGGEELEGAVGGVVGAVGARLEEWAGQAAGSFVVRELLRVLAGISEEPKVKGAGLKLKGAGLQSKGVELPASFPLLLQRLAEAFEQHLPSLLSPPCASLCLQGALQALHHSQSPACARLCDALIGLLAPLGPASGDSPLVAALEDPERGRIMEAVLGVAPPTKLRELFREQLKGRLVGVACHRLANHGLQRLLDNAPPDVVGAVLEELGPSLGQPLARGHHGVAVALMGACLQYKELQQGALRCLFQAFNCWEPPQRRRCCVGALLALQPLEGEEPQPTLGAVTPSGSQLLQLLLHFRDPSAVLGGLRALSDTHLHSLALSPPGSHVWDSIMSSPSVPPRARRRLVRRLKGHFLSLACHRNGSRVLDAILASCSSPTRASIASELAPQRRALLRDPHGRHVEHRLQLELFLRSRSQWEQLWAAPRGTLGTLLED